MYSKLTYKSPPRVPTPRPVTIEAAQLFFAVVEA